MPTEGCYRTNRHVLHCFATTLSCIFSAATILALKGQWSCSQKKNALTRQKTVQLRSLWWCSQNLKWSPGKTRKLCSHTTLFKPEFSYSQIIWFVHTKTQTQKPWHPLFPHLEKGNIRNTSCTRKYSQSCKDHKTAVYYAPSWRRFPSPPHPPPTTPALQ